MTLWYLVDRLGRPVQHYEMYERLGFKKGHHIPPDMEETRRIGDVYIHILPSRGGSKHRVFYDCPRCDKLVPFGRVGQHCKGREHKLNCEIVAG